MTGGLELFKKLEHCSKIFIFIVIITFSFAMIDWVMSIDAHWYSTIFAIKNFVAAFHHAAIVITFIVLLMNQRGYFPFLNKSHLGDFSRYIFMLCIIWGYFWFAEFMLIWYANIPEETAYFIPRVREKAGDSFSLPTLLINWFLPFVLLMPKATARNQTGIENCDSLSDRRTVYRSLYPDLSRDRGRAGAGIPGDRMFVGFAGLVYAGFGLCISRANLYPVNHPYLEECKHHHT